MWTIPTGVNWWGPLCDHPEYCMSYRRNWTGTTHPAFMKKLDDSSAFVGISISLTSHHLITSNYHVDVSILFWALFRFARWTSVCLWFCFSLSEFWNCVFSPNFFENLEFYVLISVMLIFQPCLLYCLFWPFEMDLFTSRTMNSRSSSLCPSQILRTVSSELFHYIRINLKICNLNWWPFTEWTVPLVSSWQKLC